MGLFGSSPQKKLEKARSLLAREDYFGALQLYREVAAVTSRVSPGDLFEAQEGSRTCRRAMIELRLQEAEALRQAGDLEGARDRCQTAFDLAGEDLDAGAIEETLQRINAPRRPVALAGRLRDALEDDLLPGPDETVTPRPGPLDKAPEPPPQKSDTEIFGDDPEALFELTLHSLEESTAGYYRSLGPDFRFGYLALNHAEGRRALDFFERMDWSSIHDPRALLERAHALLLADRAEESLAELDALASADLPPGEDDRRRYLRVEALRALERLEEAVAGAKELAETHEEPTTATEALLAWTLLEAGRAEEAYARLAPWLAIEGVPEEILIPAAQAAGAAGRVDEEARLLHRLIQRRMERSIQHETEMDFPVEAGRRLLAIYLDSGEDPEEIRALVLHLVDHDLERGETYRSLLLELEQSG